MNRLFATSGTSNKPGSAKKETKIMLTMMPVSTMAWVHNALVSKERLPGQGELETSQGGCPSRTKMFGDGIPVALLSGLRRSAILIYVMAGLLSVWHMYDPPGLSLLKLHLYTRNDDKLVPFQDGIIIDVHSISSFAFKVFYSLLLSIRYQV